MRPLMLAVMLAAGAAIGFFGRPLVKRDAIERPSAVDLNDAAAILDAGNIVDPLSDVSPSPTPTPALNPATVARDQARAAKLGADLMRKVGARFVGLDERDGLFFDTPKPFGDSLCRVNMYAVSENIRGAPDQDSWTDDLAIERRYAIWTSPSRPDRSDADARSACAAYRDFEHTFSADDSLTVERDAVVFDALLTIARGNAKPPFPLSCSVIYAPKNIKACDALAVLRRFALTDLVQVRNESTKYEGPGSAYSDTLFMRERGKLNIAISIEGVRQPGRDSEAIKGIKRAEVVIDRECGG